MNKFLDTGLVSDFLYVPEFGICAKVKVTPPQKKKQEDLGRLGLFLQDNSSYLPPMSAKDTNN